ncbi:hypothetical protein GQ457_17G014940 [Hibiscus cannabinus]
MAPASPGIGDTTTAFPLAFTCRWSLDLSRSVAESSVEVPCSIRWSHGFQVFQGLTSGSSKPVKAEEVDQGWVYAMVKGWDCSFSMEKAPFRLERMCCLKLESWMTRPIPLSEIGACLPCELSPRSFFKRKMHVFRPVFYQLFKVESFFCEYRYPKSSIGTLSCRSAFNAGRKLPNGFIDDLTYQNGWKSIRGYKNKFLKL